MDNSYFDDATALDDFSEDDRYDNGRCDVCEGPIDDDYECLTCQPRTSLEETPVLGSWLIVDGVVSVAVTP